MVFEKLNPELEKIVRKRFKQPTLPQQLTFDPILEGKNVLLLAPVGTGKCVGKDTLILTPDGPKEIAEYYGKRIEVNSINKEMKTGIFTGNVIQKRKSKLYEVETNTGRRIKVTDDHKFLTIRNGNLLWLPLREFEINDYVAIARKSKLFEHKSNITFDLFEEYLDKRICFVTNPSVSEILNIIKEKKGFGLRRLAKIIGCHRATLMRGRKGKHIRGRTIKNLVELAELDKTKLEIISVSFPHSKPFLIPEINENFAYFIGLIIGDGNFNQDRTIRFTTASSDLLNLFKNYLFKLNLKLGKDKSRKYDYYTTSKPLLYLLYALGLPSKNKSSTVKILPLFFNKYGLLSSVLRGIYDTDGSIYGNTIELTTKSKRLSDELLLSLSCFGIVAIRKTKHIKGKEYQRILIQNVLERKLFRDKIDFFKPDKKLKLMNSLNYSSNPNLDIIPEISSILRKLKDKMNVKYKDTPEDKLYYAYVGMNAENPSRASLLKILYYFQENSSNRTFPPEFILLQKLALSDIFWDRVKSIKEAGFEFVYDASIPETKNFIGSGIVLHNTESVMLPLFSMVMDLKPNPISILYITPLKSLNRDLLDRLMWWCNEIGIEASVRHGDTSQYERKLQAEFPPQLLITTPETVQAILPGRVIREHLKNIRWIVIDEVHEIVDSKRGVQLSLALERLRALAGHDFQIIGLSATVENPEHVAKFICPEKPIEIIRATQQKEIKIKVISPKSEIKDKKIANALNTSTETAARIRTIMGLIKEHRSILVFTNTREFAEILANRIKTLDRKFPAGIHHSSLSKEVRIKTEKEFKKEEIKAIISTSSLQLGIDIGSVDLVLQYMSPRQVSQIIQRVGRSGHERDRISEGIIISTDEDDVFESAVIARKAMAGELEKLNFHEAAYDVLAHQLVGLTLDHYRIDLQKAYEIISHSHPFARMTFPEFLEVCKQLEQLHLIFLDNNITKKRRGFEYYFTQLSTIPDTKHYRVMNMIDQSFVGVVDEEFVALHGEPGTSFILKGEAYRVIQIEEDRLMVEPTIDIEAAVPGWEGELIPVPFEVAQEVGRLRAIIFQKLKEKEERKVVEDLQYAYPLDENSAKKMMKVIKGQTKYGIIPDDKTILIEDIDNTVVIHAAFGTVVNETLGRFITSLLTSRVGSVGLKIDPYRIILQFQSNAKSLELVKETLFTVNPQHLRSYLEMNLTRSSLFEWKFVHVAKRFGAISREAEYGKVRLGRIIDSFIGTPLYKETLKELEVEKFDIAKAMEILGRIQEKKIAVIFKPGLSLLGKYGLRHAFAEVVGPQRPEAEIFELFKRRIFNTTVRLVCMNCGQWSQTYIVEDISKNARCGKCSAKLLAVVHPRNSQIVKIIKKGLRKTATVEEMRNFERTRKTADLFLVYGKKAAVALAARGVGPVTARRILARYHKDDDAFMRDLLDAERQFIKTRKFWSS